MNKSKKEENVENNSPMGAIESLPKIETITEAPRPVGQPMTRVKIPTIYITNYLNNDVSLWWDSKEYIYKARTKSPVQIGGVQENQNVRKKWAYDLAVKAWYADHPQVEGDKKARYPRDTELTSYVQRALEEAPVSEAELGEEKNLEIVKDYHVLKATSHIKELGGQE